MRIFKPLIFVLVFLICLQISGCFISEPTIWRPESGVWYCEELQIRLSFETGIPSYVIIDGEKIGCSWQNNIGSQHTWLACTSDNKDYRVGDELFCCKFVELTEDQYIVKACDTGVQYTFLKIG